MNLDWLQHVVGIQPQRAPPERRFEDVVYMLAGMLFPSFHKQFGPFKRPQDAGGERDHISPPRIVSVVRLTIEGLIQRCFGCAVVGIDIYDVHQGIPFSEGALLKTGIRCMVDLEDEERG